MVKGDEKELDDSLPLEADEEVNWKKESKPYLKTNY